MMVNAMAAIAAATMMPQAMAAPAAPAASDIELMVLREVNGNTAKPGDPVRFQVNRAVAVEGGVIPAGTLAWGEVTAARSSGIAMAHGTISVRLVRMVVNGVEVGLSGQIESAGHGGKSDTAVKLIFAPWYAVFSPGNTGKLKAGEIVHGQLPAGFRLSPAVALAPGS